MVRPVRDVAIAIEEQDLKQLSALPGIGSAMAERIVAKLRRKMAKFALMIQRDLPPELEAERGVFNDAYEALVALGHSPPEARQRIEQIASEGMKFKSVEDVLEQIYRTQQR
jgi:Holliday junction DNA helicase RuvA